MTAADRPALRALIRAARTQADTLRGTPAARPEIDHTREVTAALWEELATAAEEELAKDRAA